MTDNPQTPSPEGAETDSPAGPQLAAGTYEVLRNRLGEQSDELSRRLDALNLARKAIFGSIDTQLIATSRITTDHNCLPRDLFAIGDRFLFGYNVKIGLKTETKPEDVFAVYSYRDHQFHAEEHAFLRDERFVLDFRELYRYYRKTTFVKFAILGPHLYMVFRIGDSLTDVKTFKWTIVEDQIEYNDNRSDHEYRFPPQHEFEWTRTHRDLHRSGLHPHVSVEDRVFVETVGGDLTIKVEDNTEDGEGIYSESVDNADQTLDDADIFYAIVGSNILLKIRPYQENAFRYLVYNEKIQEVKRIDAIDSACVLLPDDHGLIFSNGYYLESGELKIFDTAASEMLFERRITAPNGEDYLYVFYNRRSGTYVLLSYNLIDQEVRPPITCNGFSVLDNGELIYFKEHGEPQKHHTAQIWQTPFVDEEVPLTEGEDSFLFKIGNRELVRCMAECHELMNLSRRDEGYANLYVDLVRKSADLLDSYFWISDPEAESLSEPLIGIRSAASAAVDEFDKVTEIRRRTAEQFTAIEQAVAKTEREIQGHRFQSLDEFVSSLADLRRLRGEVIALRDLRYADRNRADRLDEQVAERSTTLAGQCVEFLLEPTALDPYRNRVLEAEHSVPSVQTVAAAREVETNVDGHAHDLELLIETVSGLQIDDATQRTAIVNAISEIFAHVNQVRAALKRKTKELLVVEGAAEFGSQIRLLSQSVVSSLDLCDSPQRCDEHLTKLMVQLEELDARFAEFDEFVDQISDKRQEVYDAFESRKLQLVEKRNRRAEGLLRTADRILQGVETRLESLKTVPEIHSYFAADPMVAKVRSVVEELLDLDDSVKADEIQSRLKAIRENAVRQLKDRQDLFVDGENIIRFGDRTFAVNVQPLDLTTVVRDGDLYLHLTGSNYFEKIQDDELAATRSVWGQELLSEDASVYRAEYLAHRFVRERRDLARLRTLDEDLFFEELQRFAAPRYREGYIKGVHDRDASRIARGVIEGMARAGVLRYPAQARAIAWLAWRFLFDDAVRDKFEARLRGLGAIRSAFGDTGSPCSDEVLLSLAAELETATTRGGDASLTFDAEWIPEAAEFLQELFASGTEFGIGPRAAQLLRDLRKELDRTKSGKQATQFLEEMKDRPLLAFVHARDWVNAYIASRSESEGDPNSPESAESTPTPEKPSTPAVTAGVIDEVALALVERLDPRKNLLSGETPLEIDDLLGDHGVIQNGTYRTDVSTFLHRVGRFEREICPRFTLYQEKKRKYLAEERERIRLDEFRARVLTSFVRNRLIDRHYLPMIGDNLAKQIGVAGADKRTDLMGLLLLVSPPGYGKTTLMEYVASRLGLTFVKINGPAIGHRVTSLDPNEAPNAGAREEVDKLNFALELGDNVMIYLDDIQHTNPEFLQKFISLCDGQRRIEGVFRGRTRTYDLRGKKVAVVMAGNPYTESGEKFQIPDMLANRADTYNLGDIIGDNRRDFELSYVENCLSSNPVLDKLASRSQEDLYGMLAIAETGSRDGVEFESDYSAAEVEEIVSVLKKLLRIRDVILKVNTQYIASAAQADDYRTEPPFQLQGSYRNMAKLAEKVLPVMNDEELETLIDSHYESESQTLTSGAEANFLKFKELLGSLTEEESARWDSIRSTFARNNKLRGMGGDDRAGQVVLQLTELGDSLTGIRDAISQGVASQGGASESLPPVDFARTLAEALRETTGPDRAPDVRVVNKIPQSFLRVIRQQFAVMQSWMLPLIELLRETAGSDELRKQFDGARASYDSLIDQLEKGEVEDANGDE